MWADRGRKTQSLDDKIGAWSQGYQPNLWEEEGLEMKLSYTDSDSVSHCLPNETPMKTLDAKAWANCPGGDTPVY